MSEYDKMREQNFLMSDEWRNKLIKDMVNQAAILGKVGTVNCEIMCDLFRKAARELTYAHYELEELRHQVKQIGVAK